MAGGEGLEDISGVEESTEKVVIPGLPDESESAAISSGFWEWKPKLEVHYEKAGCENVNSPALLFLPGFGVGSFHYEKQLKDLGRDFRVWALDFLGQGKSLPIEDPAPLPKEANLSEQQNYPWGFGDKPEPWAKDLVYSVDLWRDQVKYFVEEVSSSCFPTVKLRVLPDVLPPCTLSDDFCLIHLLLETTLGLVALFWLGTDFRTPLALAFAKYL